MLKNQHYLSNRTLLIVIAFVVIVIQVIDNSAGQLWTNSLSDRMSPYYLLFFSILIIISISIHIFFLYTARKIIYRIKKSRSPFATKSSTIYTISQILLIIFLTYLFIEQLTNEKYPILVLKTIVGLSFMVPFFILILLSFTFLKSYRYTKSKTLLIYGLAVIALSAHMLTTFLYIEAHLANKPEYISPTRNPWTFFYITELHQKLYSFYSASETVAFIAIWLASLLFTNRYTKKIDRTKHLIILTIPLILFILLYHSPILLDKTGITNMIQDNFLLYDYFHNFGFNAAKISAGVLFGIYFFMLTRIVTNKELKYYLIVSGVGLMIIFSTSVSVIMILVPYPSWTIISISFILSATYLTMIGLDSATFNITKDITIRRFLNMYENQLPLFKGLSSAENLSTFEKKAEILSKKIYENMESETIFMDKTELEDVKEYVKKVIKEKEKRI